MTDRIKQGNNDLLLFSYILPPSDHICLVSRRQPRAQGLMGRTMSSQASYKQRGRSGTRQELSDHKYQQIRPFRDKSTFA